MAGDDMQEFEMAFGDEAEPLGPPDEPADVVRAVEAILMVATDPVPSDLLAQLRWVADAGSQLGASPVAAQSRRVAIVPWVALAVGAVVLAAGIPLVATRIASSPEPQPVRFTVAGMPPAGPVPVSLSPDGRWLIGSPGGAGSHCALRPREHRAQARGGGGPAP